MNWNKTGYRLRITHWEGRLGNNIQQLCCALFIAEKTNSLLTYPDHAILLNKMFDFTVDSQEVCQSTNRTSINDSFFNYANMCGQFLPDYNFVEQRRICEAYINSLIVINNDFEINEKDLVIHIRSGDAFIGKSHPLYVEEPLSYYKTVINNYFLQHNTFKIIIVTEPDLINPCINGIINYIEYLNLIYAQDHIMECVYNPIEYTVDTDFTNAIILLLKAKNLVLANSSFSQRLSLCNKSVKNIYCSNLSVVEKYGKHNENGDINYHFHSIANYINFGEWKNTKEQIHLMMTHPSVDVKVSDVKLPAHFTKTI